MSDSTRIAIVGAGAIAREHIRALLDIPDVEVAGICAPSSSRSEKVASEFSIPNVFTNPEQMCSAVRPDGVVVAVPVAETKVVCLSLLGSTKVLLVEKPLGCDLEEAEVITERAQSKGVSIFVALNRRHFSSTKTVMDSLSIDQGQRIVLVRDQEDIRPELVIGHPKIVIENWMFANSIHLIDYFTMFCRGDLVKVKNSNEWTPGLPQFMLAHLTYSSGDVGVYEAIWNRPSPWSVSITTANSNYELRPLESLTIRNSSRPIRNIEADVIDQKFKPGFREQAQQFVNAIRGASHGLPSLESTMCSIRLVDALYPPRSRDF